MKRIELFTIILLLAALAHAQNNVEKVFCDKAKSTITYSMHHPLHSWEGISKNVISVILTDSKRDKINQVAVSVKIASFDSKNANRDSHTMEVTEALKFPAITFNSTSIEQTGTTLNVKGILSFHGLKKEISFEANKAIKKNKLNVTGNFSVIMTEFGIKPPSLMAMATDDEIKITFDVWY